MKKTINQIRVELSKLSLAHAQINSFFWGDFLRAYKERELDYPLSCCYYPTANLYTNQTEIPITIIICDKIYKDWSNLNDVESDTLNICRALFNVINMSQTWQLLGRVQSCTVTKFVERGGDEVAGHQMQINFRLRDKSGICDLPIFGYDFDQDFATGCEPVLIFKDGLLIDTVPSGGIYEYFSDICEDARVRNSDNSYSDTVPSGGVLDLPDITVTDSDGSTFTQPSVTNVTCTIQPPCQDSTFNINTIEVGTAPSGGALNLNLIDQNSDVVPFVQLGSDLVVISETFIKGIFASGNDVMETLIIDADSEGNYTSTTNDGGSGTITFEKNSIPVTLPFTLAIGDTLDVERTVTTSVGFFKLIGTI